MSPFSPSLLFSVIHVSRGKENTMKPGLPSKHACSQSASKLDSWFSSHIEHCIQWSRRSLLTCGLTPARFPYNSRLGKNSS
ncbi:hypothetical protein BDV26DRAFT_263872 [Aspergillus bertholletiae]|uniref:Uncharacterized protein n=1 Tax=Aspergillus bertholletiae TaxID=1226010 RepID=A0A5N7B5M4_9EURO|nr:hypothetical protein BDV26DRAFT_263872 [Aspergillus bertholletiae]